MKYCVLMYDYDTYKYHVINIGNDKDDGLRIAKNADEYVSQNPVSLKVVCREYSDDIQIDENFDFSKETIKYNEIYPVVEYFHDEDDGNIIGYYSSPGYREKFKPKYNKKLIDVISEFDIEKCSQYGAIIMECLEARLDELSDKMLMYDDVPENLESSFDDLSDIVENINQILVDVDRCIDDKIEDENIKNKVQKIKKDIIWYQDYYGGLKSLKI